jgi:hypothetical protein
VVYTSSFEGAKVVANVKTGLLGKLRDTNNFVNLRFCFKPVGETNTVTFFVAGRVLSSAPYGNSPDINIFNIQFTNRPPDDFIEIMGRLLDATVNSSKRKDDRIQINADNIRKLNLLSSESTVFIDNVPRRCILRDLSFSGSKIIMMGITKFLLDKEAILRIDFNDPRESFAIKGKFVRAENVEGKKEMVALGLYFTENAVPMGFKLRINDFLTAIRADYRSITEEELEAQATVKASAKPAAAPPAGAKPAVPAAARPAAPAAAKPAAPSK